MKKLIIMVSVLAMVCLVSGCGNKQKPLPTQTTVPVISEETMETTAVETPTLLEEDPEFEEIASSTESAKIEETVAKQEDSQSSATEPSERIPVQDDTGNFIQGDAQFGGAEEE